MDKREYLPPYLLHSPVFRDVYQANMDEVAGYHRATDDLTDQAYIKTATWGLRFWESFLGIPVDEMKAVGERRSEIQSRLRGYGTATVDLIKTVANAYDNGAVDIRENVRNRIPPMQTSDGWSLHANASAYDEYVLHLQATGPGQESFVTMKATPNTDYFFTGYVNHADAYYTICFYNESNAVMGQITPSHVPGINTYAFRTPAGTVKIRLSLKNFAAGDFTFRDFMIAKDGAGEKFQPYRPHTFTVEFVGERGMPPNLDDLQAAIQRVKPAHLDIIYKFRYLMIKEVHGMMISELETKPIELFAGRGDE